MKKEINHDSGVAYDDMTKEQLEELLMDAYDMIREMWEEIFVHELFLYAEERYGDEIYEHPPENNPILDGCMNEPNFERRRQVLSEDLQNRVLSLPEWVL